MVSVNVRLAKKKRIYHGRHHSELLFFFLTDDGELYIASSGGVAKVNIAKPFEKTGSMKVRLPYIVADGM